MTKEAFVRWRKQQDWSQREAATYFGVHEDTVANWESGRRPVPKPIEIAIIATAKKKKRPKSLSTP